MLFFHIVASIGSLLQQTIKYPQGIEITVLLVGTLILSAFVGAFSSSRSFFSFAFSAWFFVVLPATSFSENAILLDLAIKTLQGSLKRFVIADFDFRHQGFPPLVACFKL